MSLFDHRDHLSSLLTKVLRYGWFKIHIRWKMHKLQLHLIPAWHKEREWTYSINWIKCYHMFIRIIIKIFLIFRSTSFLAMKEMNNNNSDRHTQVLLHRNFNGLWLQLLWYSHLKKCVILLRFSIEINF